MIVLVEFSRESAEVSGESVEASREPKEVSRESAETSRMSIEVFGSELGKLWLLLTTVATVGNF